MTKKCRTGKPMFRDRIAADLAVATMNTKRRGYPCNLCGKWHHTTQSERHSAKG